MGVIAIPSKAKVGYGPTDWLGGWRTLLIGSAVITVVFIGLTVWSFQWWREGLDAASAGFDRYWRRLFWVELAADGLIAGVWWGWLIRSGRALAARPVTVADKVRRTAIFWGYIAFSSMVLYWMAGYWPNWDGAWHQTVVRDTALTPPHITMFYFTFPLGIITTVATYLYGMTRLPEVYSLRKGIHWAFFLLISASVLETMQVAFNEFGHSWLIVEEIFAVPYHYPFVTYGWLAGGIFALWGETVLYLFKVEKEHAEEQGKAEAVPTPTRYG
ncbi:MAG TPA: methane monooxygenase/ammonia monooxygenase subunit C [Chloroflexota bacterium]